MAKRIDTCADCGRERPIYARGLCTSCAGRSYRKTPNIICASCGEKTRNCARGLCGRCYQQHRNAGTIDQFPLPPRINVTDRLNEVKRGPDECWPWNWRVSVQGYGTVVIKKVEYKAHVLAYELWVGPVPAGLVVDHICHNADLTCLTEATCMHRRCVNPAHLEAVPSGVNTLRGHTLAGANAAKTHCDQGHEFTPENTYTPPPTSKRPRERTCKTCRRIRCREWKRKKRAERRGVVYVPAV